MKRSQYSSRFAARSLSSDQLQGIVPRWETRFERRVRVFAPCLVAVLGLLFGIAIILGIEALDSRKESVSQLNGAAEVFALSDN